MLTVKPPAEASKVKPYNEDPAINRFYGTAGGFLYFRWINKAKESILKETVKLRNHENLEICPPETNSD